jgi:hypothetical protein
MLNRNPAVDQFMQVLEHPLKAEIALLCDVILDSDAHISEQIKWNAPSFGYAGEDRITFNLRAADRMQLIFHRGAKVKSAEGFIFGDPAGLMTWPAVDRGIVTLHNMQEIEIRQDALLDVVQRWMQATNV